MRLNELYESSDPYKAEPLNIETKELVGLLRHECHDWVKAMQDSNSCLYRGVKEATAEDVIHGKVRPNRMPVQMPLDRQELIDEAMQTMGFEARRGNSLFMTANQNTAQSWGVPYVMFMRDNWSGTYAANFKESYAWGQLASQSARILYAGEERPTQVLRMIAELKEMKFRSVGTTSELAQLMSEHYLDVLFTGPFYYGLHISHPRTEEVLLEFGLGRMSNFRRIK